MTATNYDASQVGVPYVRAHRVTINYPDNKQMPTATIEQSLAVRMADGSARQLENLPAISCVLDFSKGNDPIPLVSNETGAPLGADTSLNQAFIAVLAVVRAEQNKAEQAAAAAQT